MSSVKEEELMQDPIFCGEKIFVSIRVRPLNEKENARNDASDWECVHENTIIYRNNLPASEKSMYPTAYTFDRVFGVDCNTRRVYEEGAKHVALSVVSGINSCIFAYGQTSSGKTYTMSGITEHTVADIFDYLQKHKEREFTLKLSALEIYNESVRDLLTSNTTPLRLLDDPEKGTVVERLTEETLRGWSHFKELLSVCETQRQIGETTMNEASSRSHQIIRLTIESSAFEFLGNGKSSSLTATVNFVDLAGSERASQTLSAGARLKEGCHINRSLLALGTVIRKLSKGRNGHVPFRDSKLTRILQSSLGGNARTAIICTMSPASSHVEQSRNTLLFASCAKEVSTNAQVNVVMSDKALVKQLQREVARLKNDLRSSGPAIVTPDSEALVKEKDLQIEKLKKEVANLTMQLEFAQSHIKDLRKVVREELPSIASPHRLYPKLLVRNAWDSENQSSESSISSGHYCTESVRSFGASHYSGGDSRSSSDAYLIELTDYEENLQQSSCPRILVKVTDHNVASDAETNVESEDRKDKSEEKEVNVCELSTVVGSNTIDISPNTCTESSMSSPVATTETSGLIRDVTRDKENQDAVSPHFETSKQENSFCKVYVVSSPERASPEQTQSNICSARSFTRSSIFTKSKSSRASLMMNTCSYWFQDEENMDRTPFIFEKESTWRYGYPLIEFNAGKERLSRESSQSYLLCNNVYQDKPQNDETSSDRTVTETHRKVDLDSEDRQDQKEGELNPELASKSVRDVGVDPMQWHGESSPDWPSEYRRLQTEIIELWHVCNVSLIHRTYFFLLFNGDPSDSIYMEVELRRLSYLKKNSSDRNQTVEDGEHDTPASSLRNLQRERQMLSKQMQKKLSETERETLYIKWGIAFIGKHRRLQLAHKLWSDDTANLEHIRDSANIVAKLVGHVEPEQAFKEMFALNFAPRLTRRKSFAWSDSMKNLLQTSV